MEAASVMIRELQDLRSPHRDATPPTDATTIVKHLVAAAVAQTRLRHDACASVLDNLRYCKQNGLTYDPLRSYTKGDATPGPDSRKKHLVQVRFESWSTFWIQDLRPSSLLWFPETAVWQAELRPKGLLLDRDALCEVGTSRVRARSRDLGSPFHPCNFNRN